MNLKKAKYGKYHFWAEGRINGSIWCLNRKVNDSVSGDCFVRNKIVKKISCADHRELAHKIDRADREMVYGR